MVAVWLAALSGGLYVLGYVGFGPWPLSLVALVPVLYAVERYPLTGARALGVGLCFGVIAQVGGTSWLVATLREFSGLPLGVCVAVYALLCIYQGGQLALFVWLCQRVKRAGLPMLAFAPLCLAAAERVYPMLFPSPFGASLHRAPPLLQLAELGGPSLLTLLLAAINAALCAALCSGRGEPRRARRWLLGTAVMVGAVAGYGTLRMTQLDARAAQAPTLSVGIVQANLGAWQKREQVAEGRRRHLEQSKQLEQGAKPDLLVWPETALHYAVPVSTKTLAPWLGSLATPVLLGALGHRVENGRALLYNSAFLADAGGRVLGRSDKLRLVPFGEYIPFGERFPRLYELSRGSGQLSPGAAPTALTFQGHRIAALICYEDVLAEHVRDVVRALDPELLVNISNDAWFGRGREPYLHQALAVLRAVEHRRYLVRAGNSGISSVIDPVGRVVAQTKPFTRQNLSAKVALLAGATPYTRLGDWAGWLALLACAYALVARRFTSPGGSKAGAAA